MTQLAADWTRFEGWAFDAGFDLAKADLAPTLSWVYVKLRELASNLQNKGQRARAHREIDYGMRPPNRINPRTGLPYWWTEE